MLDQVEQIVADQSIGVVFIRPPILEALVARAPRYERLTASFEVSFRNLSGYQRRLLCVLGFSTHLGEEFDAGTAATLRELSLPQADRLLEELFDAHMLLQRTASNYHLHDLLHEHARAKAVEELGSTAMR